MTVSTSSRPETPRARAQATASRAAASTLDDSPSAPWASSAVAGVLTAGSTAGMGAAIATGAEEEKERALPVSSTAKVTARRVEEVFVTEVAPPKTAALAAACRRLLAPLGDCLILSRLTTSRLD